MEEVAELAASVFPDGGTLPLTVKGGSMMPFLRPQKDRVVLSAATFMGLHRCDVVLARRTDGSYVLHRVWKIKLDEF